MRRFIDGKAYDLQGADSWRLREEPGATGLIVIVWNLPDGTWILEEIDSTTHRHSNSILSTPEDVAAKFTEYDVDLPRALLGQLPE